MSKKHADQITAALRVLHTEEGRSSAFSFLVGILGAKADLGKPTSATSLAKAVIDAVEYASKYEQTYYGQAWRSATETELPEPREIPDLDPTQFSHAMAGIGNPTSWCGAPGPVATFAFSVTCPVCSTMLSQEAGGDLEARTLAVSPLADDTSASDETAQAEIIIGGRAQLAAAEDAIDAPFARGNKAGRCYWCDGTTVICFKCKSPGPEHVGAAHEPNMLPCRECNGGSYPVRPPEPFRPCADCYSPLMCEEADEARCP